MIKRRGWIAAAVVALLLVLCGQIVHAVRGQSLTWDEGDHIFAGYMSWKTGDYGLNPEHPPMVKMVATLPLLALPLKVPPLQGRFFKDEAYLDGRELLFRNQPQFSPLDLVFRVRLAAMVFTIAAALLVFSAGTEMFGVEAGLIALFLFCFEPNLLAHGAYVTTDMAASCTFFATVYSFWRWVKRPSLGRLLVVGLAAGLALAAKHSTVLLAPMLVVLVVGEMVGEALGRNPTPGDTTRLRWGTRSLQLLGGLVVVVLVGVAVLWAFYRFRYAARPAGLALAPSLVDYVGPLAGREGAGILFAGRHHLLPESWLYGLADVREMANGMPSYFFGKVYSHGVWFYFPVLFTIKSTLGMMALLLLTVFAVARRWLRQWRELWFLAAPPAVYLLVAMTSGLNIGARHILLLWVFGCVLAGAGARALLRQGKAWRWVVGVLLAAHAASTLATAPNYIAYANEAWGGPTQTYKYLTDSNTDWAQQLVATSTYLRERKITDCWIAYFAAPFILPADYGIPCKRLPTPDSNFSHEEIPVPETISGTVLISAGDLNGFELGSSVLNPYEGFRKLKPVTSIQDGMFVFEGTFPVKLASALSHTLASARLLKAGDKAGALAEARTGERLAPDEVATEIALGDAAAAAGLNDEALAAYARARLKAETMEPGAREDWLKTINEKTAKV